MAARLINKPQDVYIQPNIVLDCGELKIHLKQILRILASHCRKFGCIGTSALTIDLCFVSD